VLEYYSGTSEARADTRISGHENMVWPAYERRRHNNNNNSNSKCRAAAAAHYLLISP